MANVTSLLQSGRPSDAIGGRGDYKMAHTFDLDGQATGNVVYCFTVPNGHRVRNVSTIIKEAMGLTATAKVGIYSDLVGTAVSSGTGFDASIDLDATAETMATGAGGTDAHVTAGGYLNNTGGNVYLCLTLTIASGPAAAGQVRVVALCTDET